MLWLSILLLFWRGDLQVSAFAPRAAATPLAVLDFDNHSGNPRYDPLGKGIAAMMVTDLASVPAIQLIERQRVQDLLAEMDLQRSDYADPETAQMVGSLIGAEFVVLGSIVAFEPQVLINTRIVQVSTGEIVKTAEVSGRENRLFDLQEKLADELIDGIEIALSPQEREMLRARQEQNRIDEWETMLQFSQALALYDAKDYVGGSERMLPVVRAAPQSLLVRMFYDEMRDRAADNVRDRARDEGNRFLRGLLPGR